MIKKYTSTFPRIILLFSVFIITIISIKYLDSEIALRVMYFLRSIRPLHKATEHIPDLLPQFVGLGTVLMWIFYFYRLYEKKKDILTQFLHLAAITLPVAYLLKTLLKYVFGRTGPRSWLISGVPIEFHWFNEIGSSSFPSGHMTVLTALGAAVYFYFPRYRRVVLILLGILGISLVGTDYHFLSDVIAGAYFGYITSYSLKYVLEIKRT